MTKIHIVPQGSESIEGYQKIEVINGSIDLNSLAMNECDFILASDILDEVPVSNIQTFVQLLESRTRRGGKICIGGTDIRLLSRAIISGEINSAEANEVIFRGRSCLDMSSIRSLLQSLGLKVSSTNYQGYRYEIEATR
tara:strand:+ start:182 stop:598 length:417 start_codon:yes stop_codon:yes gene_type:complete